ncbi:hypothetical protein FIBSPDRAFT_900688 [Athelia psychrophila]|uniref:DUF7918 domain-containing protein n=1 Tax=Athelia psychrophila TaxID=1759441 RepID=A0A165Y5P3_9AGAM|nr:hypothetical protein FIBSPDRAFT_900688 [Fibularhizoctonia sp. CBS 109695]
MEGDVQIDDMDCGGNVMKKSDPSVYYYWNDGFTTSAKTVKPFVFTSLNLTGACLYHTNFAKTNYTLIKSLRVKEGWAREKPPTERPVHERTKKAMTHRVQLGAETPATKHRNKTYYSKHLDKHPIAKFTFKYRPFDDLRANGVVSALEVADSSIDEPPREMIQTPQTDILIPAIGNKRKAVVVPKEEAVGDEELDGSGVTDGAELKVLQVHPPSSMSAPEVVDSSKDIDEPTPGMRQVASQSTSRPHPTLMNSAKMIQRSAIVLPTNPKKRKARVIPKEEAVSDEELKESGVADDAKLEALQIQSNKGFRVQDDAQDKLRNESSPVSPEKSALGDDLRMLRSQQIKDLEERIRTLRSKSSRSITRKAKRVKVERPAAEGFGSGEYIDLTEI